MAGTRRRACRDATIGTRAGASSRGPSVPASIATDSRERAFSTEPFCSILSETEVGSDDPVEFLERAVDFANNRLWGTLSADLVIHPSILKDPRIEEAAERAIARLRYGSRRGEQLDRLRLCVRFTALGSLPGLGTRRHPERNRVGAQHLDARGYREGGVASPADHHAQAGDLPQPPDGAHADCGGSPRLEQRASWARVPGVVVAATAADVVPRRHVVLEDGEELGDDVLALERNHQPARRRTPAPSAPRTCRGGKCRCWRASIRPARSPHTPSRPPSSSSTPCRAPRHAGICSRR